MDGFTTTAIDATTAHPTSTPSSAIASTPPNPELGEKATRRRFNAADKARILDEIDSCIERGEAGAILRREGIHRATVRDWRRQRDAGGLAGLEPARRGPAPAPVNPLQAEVDKLQREVTRLQQRLTRAETIIDFQKKVSTMLESMTTALPSSEPF